MDFQFSAPTFYQSPQRSRREKRKRKKQSRVRAWGKVQFKNRVKMQIFTEEQGLKISNERGTRDKVSSWKGPERIAIRSRGRVWLKVL